MGRRASGDSLGGPVRGRAPHDAGPRIMRQVRDLLGGLSALALALLTLVGANRPPAPWKEIPGGPGTTCAHGGDYSFFVREGDPKRLLVCFQGGGACWNYATCVKNPTYDAAVDS